MPEAWSRWEGHVVNGKFHLKKCLGGSEQSAVFLTSHPDHEAATIKLIACDPADAELQLARWRKAQAISHPNLVRIFDLGRCRVEERDLIFAVMEHAEESLAQILSERALTAEEAREMLAPILDVLACLHVQGFVLGSLKPGNVLANNDQLKLSSDGIGRVDETASYLEQPGVYDPPEMAGGRRSPAADVWSLGMTLAEVLTQHLPAWNQEGPADPVLTAIVPSPLQEIVRGCLRRDPKSRFTVADIAERLYTKSPKPEPRAADTAALPQRPPAPARSQPGPAVRRAGVVPAGTTWVWRTAFPFALALIGLAVLFAGFRFLRHPEPQTYGDAVKPELAPQTETKPQPEPKAARASRGGTDAPGSPTRASRGGVEAKPSPGRGSHNVRVDATTASQIQPQPASLRSPQLPAGNPSPGGDAADRDAGPGVVQRVLPNVPKSASDTITGTIRVIVSANVDPSGNVAEAELTSPGPSKYFARLALEAAQKWKFVPSRDSDRDFLLNFEFRNSGTRAYARASSY